MTTEMMFDTRNSKLYTFPCTIDNIYYHSSVSADEQYLLDRKLRLATVDEIQAYTDSLQQPEIPSNAELRKRFYENEIVTTIIGETTLDEYLNVIFAYDIEGIDTIDMKAEYLSIKSGVRELYPEEVTV